jgi:hypothetical protein
MSNNAMVTRPLGKTAANEKEVTSLASKAHGIEPLTPQSAPTTGIDQSLSFPPFKIKLEIQP